MNDVQEPAITVEVKLAAPDITPEIVSHCAAILLQGDIKSGEIVSRSLTITLPDSFPLLQTPLRGPAVGDDPIDQNACHTDDRGRRLCSLPPKPTRLVTLTAHISSSQEDGHKIVFHAIQPGVRAPFPPRSFFDENGQLANPSLHGRLQESLQFWSENALSSEWFK